MSLLCYTTVLSSTSNRAQHGTCCLLYLGNVSVTAPRKLCKPSTAALHLACCRIVSATDLRKYDDPPGLQDNGEIVFHYLAGEYPMYSLV